MKKEQLEKMYTELKKINSRIDYVCKNKTSETEYRMLQGQASDLFSQISKLERDGE